MKGRKAKFYSFIFEKSFKREWGKPRFKPNEVRNYNRM